MYCNLQWDKAYNYNQSTWLFADLVRCIYLLRLKFHPHFVLAHHRWRLVKSADKEMRYFSRVSDLTPLDLCWVMVREAPVNKKFKLVFYWNFKTNWTTSKLRFTMDAGFAMVDRLASALNFCVVHGELEFCALN